MCYPQEAAKPGIPAARAVVAWEARSANQHRGSLLCHLCVFLDVLVRLGAYHPLARHLLKHYRPNSTPVTLSSFNWAPCIFIAVIFVAMIHYIIKGRYVYDGPVAIVKQM